MIGLALLLGFVIGGLLGLLGGGGSILTVPALVYVIGQTPQMAVTTSLAIVGANSAMGMMFHQAQGTLNWRVALLFGGVGMGVSYLFAGVSKHVSPVLLMVAFAALMVVIGVSLLRQPRQEAQSSKPIVLWKVLGGGAGVGALTGILGVGGGFLIVPSLVMLVGMPMREAVGTSLVIIAMNSAAGFLGHLDGATLDAQLIALFVGAGLGGTFVGAKLAKRLPAARLRQAFAWFVMILGVLLLLDNAPKLLL